MKKSYITIITILLIIILCGATFLAYKIIKSKDKNKLDNSNITTEDIIKISNPDLHLENISINNFKIGDSFEPNKDYLVFDDLEFNYQYKNTFISIDKNNKIDSLGFRTTTTIDGEIDLGYKDIDVRYIDKKLENINDFYDIFNNGLQPEKQSIKNENYYKIIFTNDKLEFNLTIKDKIIYNLSLKEM